MKYLGNPNYAHDGSDRVGLLLVNHGSPDDTDTASVRRYLRGFLADPRLVELPRWLWLSILNGIILVTRPPRTARKYKQIWTAQGSPLNVICEALLDGLRARLESSYGDRLRLALGMTYGHPTAAEGLDELRNAGCTRILVLPLYPQYAAVTIGSVFDVVSSALQRWRWIPELRFVSGYPDLPEYITALADSLRAHWAEHGRAEKLLLSFHSMPAKYAAKGDPYPCFCEKTSRLLAQELRLGDDEYTLAYQSRFGRGEWLQPYTEDLLAQWRDDGVQSVDIICPGFSVDNLETLEELRVDYTAQYAEGGGELRVVPCLNAAPAHVDALEKVVRQQLQGWEDSLRAVQAVPPLRQDASA
ncbi:MAG: ferrochelatase [Gammaproteobacteria bacterium]|nr:ferrochelatase [Gammaproteobacteria bacterium]